MFIVLQYIVRSQLFSCGLVSVCSSMVIVAVIGKSVTWCSERFDVVVCGG